MKYDLISVGDKVRFSFKRGRESGKRYYDSEIVEMYENQKVFVIETPVSQSSMAEKGDLYEFVIYTDDENVSCDCTLVKTFRSEGRSLTTVRVVSPVKTAQLRAHPRYKMSAQVKYNPHEDGVDYMDEPLITRDGIVKDISGGGMKFYGNYPCTEGSKIRLMIEKQEGSMIAEGTVVGLTELDDPEDGCRYEMRVKFIKTGSSRRKKPRMTCKLPVRFSLMDEDDNAFTAEYLLKRVMHEGEVKNIGEGGARFAGHQNLELGTKLYMEIAGRDGVLLAEGYVVSKLPPSFDGSPYRYENGVKFVSLINKRGANLAEMS